MRRAYTTATHVARRYDACGRPKLDETQRQETAGKSVMKVTPLPWQRLTFFMAATAETERGLGFEAAAQGDDFLVPRKQTTFAHGR
jgi:hypothetical protein